MAAGHDAHDSHTPDDHGHDTHDDHGHDSHGTGGDFFVVPPLVIGLIIGIIIVVAFGLESGASAFG